MEETKYDSYYAMKMERSCQQQVASSTWHYNGIYTNTSCSIIPLYVLRNTIGHLYAPLVTAGDLPPVTSRACSLPQKRGDWARNILRRHDSYIEPDLLSV